MTVPYWVQDSVFYQIFPDRFHNGDPANDPPNIDPWESKPTIWGFQGGDLRGVLVKLDYLLDLGVNAIYFNPIFQASSNHRYNISDYYKIDPKLGTRADFQALLDAAHQNGIRVVIDGVFNHCGRGFFAFNDVLENHSCHTRVGVRGQLSVGGQKNRPNGRRRKEPPPGWPRKRRQFRRASVDSVRARIRIRPDQKCQMKEPILHLAFGL